LTIHLKRFQFTNVFRDKLNEMVEFPEDLDMAQFVINHSDIEGTKYQLYAISNHTGGLGSGHYTCCAKNIEDGKWYTYNDSICTEMGSDNIVSPDAYILFYKRIPAKVFEKVEIWKEKKKQEREMEKENKIDTNKDKQKEQENQSNMNSSIRREGGYKREYSEDRDTPSDKPRRNRDWEKYNDSREYEQLMLAIELSKQLNSQSKNMQIIPVQEEKSIETDGDSMRIDPPSQRHKPTNWKSSSMSICSFCNQEIPGSLDDVQVHMLTECPKYQDEFTTAPGGSQDIQEIKEENKSISTGAGEEPLHDFTNQYIN